MCDKTDIALNRLQKLIDGSGKTRQQIANDLYCDTSTITKHYKGDRNITTDYLVKYAKYFGVSVDYLLGLSNTPSYDTNLRAVCDYTGLNEKAVNTLKLDLSKNCVVDILNFLLSSEGFSDFYDLCNSLSALPNYYSRLAGYKQYIIKEYNYHDEIPKEKQEHYDEDLYIYFENKKYLDLNIFNIEQAIQNIQEKYSGNKYIKYRDINADSILIKYKLENERLQLRINQKAQVRFENQRQMTMEEIYNNSDVKYDDLSPYNKEHKINGDN